MSLRANIGGFFNRFLNKLKELWFIESTTESAGANTDNMYHDGNIGVGDFSAENLPYKLTVKDGEVGIVDSTGDMVLVLSNANAVTTTPDLLMAAQGLISAESNLFLKSESGLICFYFGGAGSGTNGANERACIHPDGRFQNDGTLSQGTTAQNVPANFCINAGQLANYFNSVSYFRNNVLLEEDFWIELTTSQGGESVWGVNQNDGSGNWHMYWNTTGSTTPVRCANGIAFEWEVNDFGANDSLVLKGALNGAAGTAIDWLPILFVKPNESNGGAVGIKRSPTTHDLEVQGTAAKTTGPNWVNISDVQLKKQINPYNLGLETILQLDPKTFVLKDDESETVRVGWIAQDIEKIDGLKDLMVTTWRDQKELPSEAEGEPEYEFKEYLALDESALVPTLVNTIKELAQRIEALENGNGNNGNNGNGNGNRIIN